MTVVVAITPVDRQVLDAMRARGLYESDGAVVRTALWHHALHLLGDVAPDVFAVEEPQPSLFDGDLA